MSKLTSWEVKCIRPHHLTYPRTGSQARPGYAELTKQRVGDNSISCFHFLFIEGEKWWLLIITRQGPHRWSSHASEGGTVLQGLLGIVSSNEKWHMAPKCTALARIRDVAPPNPSGYRENKSTMCLEREEPRIFDKHQKYLFSSVGPGNLNVDFFSWRHYCSISTNCHEETHSHLLSN